MLQRAANNAYSWWVASHIRTKQSKWLEQSLQDMEEKTQYMLKMIEEDGDSFAKRAEMYYKKRPELINFVEEFYRAFRALAERYDHLSTELQNANNTIATLCPEQVQMMDEDDFGPPNPKPKWKPRIPDDAPKAPKAPLKDWKGLISASKMQAKKEREAEDPQKTLQKSGLTKPEAVEEIDKLQKDILALQTVKEFVKSSYQSGYSKYCGIENQILEMQQKVGSLQDEFSIGKVIEDDEARKLMAETALKSCQETLAQLQNEHESQNQETDKENKKIEDARQKLVSIRREFLNEKPDDGDQPVNKSEGAAAASDKETREDVVAVKEKNGMSETLTVSKLADKIDELVNKVINLESAVSSQTVLIGRLRSEADDLHVQIRFLEGDKASLVNDKQNSSVKVKKLEVKLHGVEDLNNEIKKQNSCLQSDFSEAKSTLEDLSQKLNSVKPDEDFEVDTPRTPTFKQDPRKANTSEQDDDVKDTEVKKERASTLKDEESKEMAVKELGEARSSEEANTSKQEDIKETREVSSSGSKPEDLLEMKDKDSGESSKSESNNSSKQVNSKEMKLEESGEASSSKQVDVKENKLQEFGELSNSGRGKEEDPKDIKVLENATPPKLEAPKDIEVQGSMEANGGEGEGGQKTVAVAEKGKLEGENGTSKAPSEEEEEKKEKEKEKEFNWQQMLLNGMEDKEKILLTEYTTILRNYKDTKKKLGDMEKDRDQQFELAVQIRDLKASIAKKDEEINRLRKRLSDDASVTADDPGPESPDSEDEDIKLILMDQPKAVSPVEEKLRLEIDTILDENLDFWLRFSTSFHQVQKFKNTVQDLQQEITNLKEKKRSEDSTGDLKSEARGTFSYLKEIQTELSVWVDQSMSLKDELERRFTSLCNIQERITNALKEGVEEEEIMFSSHQAAKFQGEILNMKQENNKVRDELQAGADHGSRLQGEIDKALKELDHEFELTGATPLRHASSRSRIPLRSFIFGNKLKKQKHSIFPFSKKYQALRAGLM